jgi:hypothetical protein
LLTTISKGIEIPQALVYFISIWFFFFSFPSRLFNEYKRRIILGHHHFQTTTITAVISSDNTTKKREFGRPSAPARPKTKKKKKQSGINLPRLTERSNASKVGEDVIGLETKSYPRAK